MRAIYTRDDLEPLVDSLLKVTGDRCHHLTKVVRVKVGEEIVIIDGAGGNFKCEVINVSKREVSLKVLDYQLSEKHSNIDLALGLPKREAFEAALKNATQVGINNIYPFRADFSNWSIKNIDRVKNVIESSLIQSNNSYAPVVHSEISGLESLSELFNQYDHIILTTLNSSQLSSKKINCSERILIIVGPEGGLSDREEKMILCEDNISTLKLNTPILTTQNAILTIVGYLLGKFDVK